MKKILYIFLLLLFSSTALFAQEDNIKATQEVKEAFIEAIKTGSSASLEIYKPTTDDIAEMLEAFPVDLREKRKEQLEEAGGAEGIIAEYEKYFQRNFKELQDESFKSLDFDKFGSEYSLKVNEDEFPNNEAIKMDIYSENEELEIEVELLKLSRGWIIMEFDLEKEKTIEYKNYDD